MPSSAWNKTKGRLSGWRKTLSPLPSTPLKYRSYTPEPQESQQQRTTNLFFFFNDTATTEIYTLSLHDALPICRSILSPTRLHLPDRLAGRLLPGVLGGERSEEHTSELQSRGHLVCRLLLVKKKKLHIQAVVFVAGGTAKWHGGI